MSRAAKQIRILGVSHVTGELEMPWRFPMSRQPMTRFDCLVLDLRCSSRTSKHLRFDVLSLNVARGKGSSYWWPY